MSDSRISWKAMGLILVVFVLGIALGAVGVHVWDAHVNASQQRPNIVKQLKEELQLSSEQAKQVDAILSDDHAKYRALDAQVHAEWGPQYAALDKERKAEWDPKYAQVQQQGRDSIRAILTPDQKVKFDAFLKHLDEERQKKQAH